MGLMTYYARIVEAVFWPLQYLSPFEIPRILFDLWALSFIGAAAYARALLAKGNLDYETRELFESPLGIAFTVFFCGITGIGLFAMLWTASLTGESLVFPGYRRKLKKSEQDWIMLNEIGKNILYVVAGCAAFYTINAFSYP